MKKLSKSFKESFLLPKECSRYPINLPGLSESRGGIKWQLPSWTNWNNLLPIEHITVRDPEEHKNSNYSEITPHPSKINLIPTRISMKDESTYSQRYKMFTLCLVLDKPIYRGGEAMFAHLMYVSRYTHRPLDISHMHPNPVLQVIFGVFDANKDEIYKENITKNELRGIGVGFNWRLGKNISAGIYTLKVAVLTRDQNVAKYMLYIYIYILRCKRVFRIRRYISKSVKVDLDLDKLNYFPGDKIVAYVKVRKSDGTPILKSNLAYKAKVYIYM